MSKWPQDNEAALIAFYGDPRSQVEPQLVHVTPPFRMTYEGTRIPYLVFHKKAADALLAALTAVWDYYGRDQAKIDALGISKTAGTFNPRKIAGSDRWSNHAFGAAIDINADDNGFNKGHGNIPLPMIAAFKAQGARWGGDYHGRTDPMHFEFCNSGDPQQTFEAWLVHYGVKAPDATQQTNSPAPTVPDGAPRRMIGITATEFGGPDDPESSAYGGNVDGSSPQVALPARMPADKRSVRVFHGGKSVVCKVNDIGPWNTNDPYWERPNGRPAAESEHTSGKPAQNGRVPSNIAGIDMTPAVFTALGIPGASGTRTTTVDWEFA